MTDNNQFVRRSLQWKMVEKWKLLQKKLNEGTAYHFEIHGTQLEIHPGDN